MGTHLFEHFLSRQSRWCLQPLSDKLTHTRHTIVIDQRTNESGKQLFTMEGTNNDVASIVIMADGLLIDFLQERVPYVVHSRRKRLLRRQLEIHVGWHHFILE